MLIEDASINDFKRKYINYICIHWLSILTESLINEATDFQVICYLC